jgi:hypothetical protein
MVMPFVSLSVMISACQFHVDICRGTDDPEHVAKGI